MICEAPTPEPARAGDGHRQVTIALVVGHEPAKAGAEGVWKDASGKEIKISEYAYNTVVSGKIRAMLAGDARLDVRDVRRHLVGGYSSLPKAINRLGAEFALELHFNSAETEQANGCEMLHWHNSTRSKVFAGILQGHVREAMGNRDRGLKPIEASGRGAPFLKNTICPAVIAEPFFGSNAREMNLAMDRVDDLAKAYARAIQEIAGVIRTGRDKS